MKVSIGSGLQLVHCSALVILCVKSVVRLPSDAQTYLALDL
jgi:hypothetical protein